MISCLHYQCNPFNAVSLECEISCINKYTYKFTSVFICAAGIMSEIETVAWLHYWITWNHLSAWWDNEIMLRQHVSPPVRVHCSFASRFEGNPFVIPDTATCIMHSFRNAFTECDCPFFNFQLHLTRRNKIVTLTVTVTLPPLLTYIPPPPYNALYSPFPSQC